MNDRPRDRPRTERVVVTPLKEGVDHVTQLGGTDDPVDDQKSTTYCLTFRALPSSLEPNAPKKYTPHGIVNAKLGRRPDYRKTAPQRGYDWRWQKLRKAYVAEHPWCEDCLLEGKHVPVHEVDHVIPFKSLDDPLRLDWHNCRSRCRPHHALKTHRDKRQGPDRDHKPR